MRIIRRIKENIYKKYPIIKYYKKKISYKLTKTRLEKKLSYLNGLSFEEWFLKYRKKEIVKNIIHPSIFISECIEYKKFKKLYFKKENLTQKEIEEKEHLYNLAQINYKFSTTNITRELNSYNEYFTHFTKERNLDIDTWFDKYYVQLMSNPNFIKERRLALDIVTRRINEFYAYKNAKDASDLQVHVACLQADYKNYRNKQLTYCRFYMRDLFMFPRHNPSFISVDEEFIKGKK